MMAPLDLDKYVEIARHCKYLPENDLKVSLENDLSRAETNGIILSPKFVQKAWLAFLISRTSEDIVICIQHQ